MSNPDATMTTGEAAESIGGVRQSGCPRSAGRQWLGRGVGPGRGRSRGGYPTGRGTDPHRVGTVRGPAVCPGRGHGVRPPGTGRPAAHRAVLFPGPAARAQLRRVRDQSRPADVHAQLAHSRRRAGSLGPGRLRRHGAGGDRYRAGDHRQRGCQPDRLLRRRHHRHHLA